MFLFFGNKISQQPKPLFSLQGAQYAGLLQATALLRRIPVCATKEEQEAFKCGKKFRLLDFYGVNLTQIVTFGHVDADKDKAKGNFRFWTPRLLAEIEISLMKEETSLLSVLSDGFSKEKKIRRWIPVQGNVWVYWAQGDQYSISADKSAVGIRGPHLDADDDLPLETPLD